MTPRRVLVVGSGAREHALCWRLAGEPGVERVIAAPGNPLMVDVADVKPDVSMHDHSGLLALARGAEVELVVVGPEAPLVDGLADVLAEAGVDCFGPTMAAARLEGSKAFTREVCGTVGVPMAEGQAFDDVQQALAFCRQLGVPLVVKADGLAAGKGVAICGTLDEAELHIRASLEAGRFGLAGARVVVERLLEGREASVIAICDGETCLVLPAARDHKRLLDGDVGPNTGGMGAYSPIEEMDDADLEAVARAIHVPVLAEVARRGTPFRGALYAGLMLTAEGPHLLEFNVRLGDPETQAILPRLAVPLAPLLAAAGRGRLASAAGAMGIEGSLVPAAGQASVAVTLAAAGYPDSPRAGDPIGGIEAARQTGALVFGAGLSRERHGRLVTAGGRVLSVVGSGPRVEHAARSATAAAELVTFAGRQMRTDIGRAGLLAGEAA